MKLKLALIPYADYAHRLWSMCFAIIAAGYSAAAGAWVLLPPDWQPHIALWGKWVLAFIGVALPAMSAASRVVAQPDLHQEILQSKATIDNSEHA